MRPLSGTSSFVKWHSAVHELFCLQWIAITFLSMSEFNLIVFPLLELLWVTWKPRKIYTYLYGGCVYNQLQNKNHRCQCKQMHGNCFRITKALCHLTAVLSLWPDYIGSVTTRSESWYAAYRPAQGPPAVADRSNNLARRRVTSLIATYVLPLTDNIGANCQQSVLCEMCAVLSSNWRHASQRGTKQAVLPK